MAQDKDIDDIRDAARDDARQQTDRRESSDLMDNVKSVVSPIYNPPSDPDERAGYDRVYRDERSR